MQLIERVNDKILKESISVLKLSKDTGIPAYRIYKWIDGKGNPKAADSAILEKWLSGNLDKVPHSSVIFDQNDPAYLAGQLAMAERLIAKLEENNEEAKEDKNKLFKALEEAQKAINEVLKPIKEQTAEILTSSKKIDEGLQSLKTEVAAENGEIMATLDQIAGNEIGTTAARAGTVEIGHRIEKAQRGKKANIGKQD
jgi:hypothetical protein